MTTLSYPPVAGNLVVAIDELFAAGRGAGRGGWNRELEPVQPQGQEPVAYLVVAPRVAVVGELGLEFGDVATQAVGVTLSD